MNFSIHLSWWAAPLAITFISIYWAFWKNRASAWISGTIGLAFCLIPAMLISMVAWIIAGFLK